MRINNIKLAWIISFFGLILILSGCVTNYDTNSQNKPIDLSAQEFKELIQDENVFVLDVHIPEQQHIKGTDALIPFDQIQENLDRLPEDKNTPIAVYCRSGSMSEQASEELSALGYKKVYNLLGGAKAWRAEGFEFEEE